jgi:phenylacetate-CoA ligase
VNEALKKIYWRLPAGPRSLIASGYGYYLRSWRYGRDSEGLIEQALERESWSPARVKAWQQERLAQMLHVAATRVPYYRRQWRDRRQRGDNSSWEDLDNWPVLSKEPLRKHPEAFLVTGTDPRKLFRVDTSGSTGTPVTTWRSKATMRHWYALFEARWRRWYGVRREDRWAILGGKIVTPFSQERSPFWVWNQGLNQLYMSTFHLKPSNAASYLEALGRYRITYLYGYASSMYALARDALEQGLSAPELKVAISNAEPLLPMQRETISRAFGCPTEDTYGTAEAVVGASECRCRRMHLWPEVGYLEVFDDHADFAVPAQVEGRLICTGLLNSDMPLIRYEIGDRGSLAVNETPCGCGRSLPVVEQITGRLSDNLITADGRRVFQMDHVFYATEIKEAQIIQERVGQVRVRLVPGECYGARDVELISGRLRERLGDVAVVVETVSELERSESGKFRAVINRLAV